MGCGQGRASGTPRWVSVVSAVSLRALHDSNTSVSGVFCSELGSADSADGSKDAEMQLVLTGRQSKFPVAQDQQH